ncbi:hypothetical protein KW805_01990 [Candidatus Pacearchaeota archaeon]|nr:hypothetical protein [Candidatus Pacearchaeota archaeon]
MNELALDTAILGPSWGKALSLARSFAIGKMWLIGGSVYRTLAHQLYNSPAPQCDFDFIVEHASKNLGKRSVPPGWIVEKNRHGNPKFLQGDISVDIIPLGHVGMISSRNLSPTIDNHLAIAPLTIQSIAYNIETHNLMGSIGINALRKKEVGIHDHYHAIYYSYKKGKPLYDLIKETAESLHFKPIYINED